MMFHHYLQDILGSEIKVRLLRLLCGFPKRGFGMRELARLLEVDHRSVSRIVEELQQQNLVMKRIFGRTHALYFNTDSYLYPTLRELFQKEENTLPEIVALIKKHISAKEVKVCAIFGSVAEEKEKYNSDVDLVVITSDKEKVRKKLEPLLVKILGLFGNPLSTMIFTPHEFAVTNPALRENIIKKHLLIYGKW